MADEPDSRVATTTTALSTVFHDNALKAVERIHAERELLHVFTDDDGVNSFSWNVSDVVVMSTTSLEAGINEIAEFIEAHPLYPCPMPDEFDRLRLRMKWSLLPLVVRVDPFDRGGSPWQDFHALVELRNALVHYRLGQPAPPWTRYFTSRHMQLAKPNDWLLALHSFKVAVWAVNTAAEMFRALTTKLGKTQTGDWSWRGFASCDANGVRIPWT